MFTEAYAQASLEEVSSDLVAALLAANTNTLVRLCVNHPFYVVVASSA